MLWYGWKPSGVKLNLYSAGADGGPRSRVCAHLTLRSAPHVHQQKFLAHMSGGGVKNEMMIEGFDETKIINLQLQSPDKSLICFRDAKSPVSTQQSKKQKTT